MKLKFGVAPLWNGDTSVKYFLDYCFPTEDHPARIILHCSGNELLIWNGNLAAEMVLGAKFLSCFLYSVKPLAILCQTFGLWENWDFQSETVEKLNFSVSYIFKSDVLEMQKLRRGTYKNITIILLL